MLVNFATVNLTSSMLRAIPRVNVRYAHSASTIIFSNYGKPLEVLKSVKHTIPSPRNDEVVLKLLTAPINPSDINQIEGVYPSKPEFKKQSGLVDEVAVPGNEGVFEVVEKGPSSNLKIGDWVIPKVSCFGTWSTYKLSNTADLINLNYENGSKLTAEQAATLSVNASTAYRMLKDFVKLSPGDWFIQNGGTSGVAKIAVQLGRLWGLKSISIVRDRSDIQKVKQELHELGCDHVLTEEQINDRSVKTVIGDWTNGNYPKLGLNCVGGKSCTNMARQLGQNGHLVTFGGMSKEPVILPTSLHIFKNITSEGFWMTRWAKEHDSERVAMIEELATLFKNGHLVETGGEKNHVDLQNHDENVFLNLVTQALSKNGKQFLTTVLPRG